MIGVGWKLKISAFICSFFFFLTRRSLHNLTVLTFPLYLLSNPDGPLTRSLHHQSSSACPHSHGNPQLTPQTPAQGEFLIPHTFHAPLSSHPPGHAVPPAPPPSLSTHHLTNSSAQLAQHLPADHQTLPHMYRMEVQRRRMMQHPT